MTATDIAQSDTLEDAIREDRVVWAPNAGSQDHFLSCPVFELLFHGTRGPGKTDALLMAFAQHTGKGFGQHWRGVVFRRTFPELDDLIAKSERWLPLMFPSAIYNRVKKTWRWPTGEALLFRRLIRPSDFKDFQGHEYPFIGFEELTNWPSADCYKPMFSCCRSSHPDVPNLVRATCNPSGPGHNWVKDRFRLAGRWREMIYIDDAVDEHGNPEKPRAAIHGHMRENPRLPKDYATTIVSAATSAAMREAWLDGDWDIVAGGMFDDIWSERNVVAPFEVPVSWRIDRAFDWGSSKPFSVGWYAESDGTDLTMPDGRVYSTVRGDLFRIREWYGFTGQPNQGVRMSASDIAEGIVEREILWRLRGVDWCRVQDGPADTSIFTVENGNSYAMNMAEPVHLNGDIYDGVDWLEADKRPGSRKMGWEQMREMIEAANPKPGLPRERPALFVVGERNPQFLRTVLSLPRSEKDPDDADTDAEDHVADEVRYRCRFVGGGLRTGTTRGHS